MTKEQFELMQMMQEEFKFFIFKVLVIGFISCFIILVFILLGYFIYKYVELKKECKQLKEENKLLRKGE